MEPKKPQGRRGISRWLTATLDQAKDTGMAMVLICLLLGYFGKFGKFLPAAIALLLLTMIWPQIFRPLAGIWFGASRLMGEVVSRIILTVLFFLIVTPIGVIRRLMGADALQLKKWKQNRDSVFVVKQGPVQDKDLVQPF